MESLSEECKNLYSWWWDSHISPRNSKWLQENLTDMDTKVKSMIKLIEEDADSFARRAEMYYKKRPELLKLVEHFYRAYRALAERHDHLTGELRQAHCTIAETFPNHSNLLVKDDDHPPLASSPFDAAPHTPEKIQTLLREEHSLPISAEFGSSASRSGLKQIQDITVDKETTEETYGYKSRKSVHPEAAFRGLQAEALSNENDNLKALTCLDCQNAIKGECEIRDLKRALLDMKAEKESIYHQYQICVRKLSEVELMSQAENESRRLSEQTVQAQLEVQTMKQAFARLELEKEAAMAIQKESLELLNDLKGMNSHTKENLDSETKAMLQTLISIQSQSQKDHEALALELKTELILLKKLELREMEASHKEVKELQYKNQFLYGANSAIFAEKAALIAQIQTLSENMQRVLNKNAVLENSLSGARIELEGLKEKSMSLEEIFHSLKNEKFALLTQKGTLVVQLANAEGRSEYLEKRLAWFEEKYAELKKEKENMQFEIEGLSLSLSSEKNERINSMCHYETRVVSMERDIHRLEDENTRKKKEYEDEHAQATRSRFEAFIFQIFLQDLEEKKCSLLTECQKHVEASVFAEKLISELRNENLEQQVEADLLREETERLRYRLYHVFKAFIPGSHREFEDKIENEQILVDEIIRNIDQLKQSATKYKDDAELLKVENLVLVTLNQQTQIERIDIKSKKEVMEQELNFTTEKVLKLQNDKCRLVEMNDLLKSQVEKGIQETTLLQAGTEKSILDLRILEIELKGVKDVLRRREAELSEAEEKLKAEEGTNLELSKKLVEVKNEYQGSLLANENLRNHVLKLIEVKRIQQKEIEDLLEMNANLMCELCKLHEVCKRHKNNEENLRADLKDKNNEATAFFLDLEISSIQGVVYENMVRELRDVCKSLEDQILSRAMEIQELKEKTSFMDTETRELKAEMSDYERIIASLGNDVASLEHNTLLHLKLELPDTSETKCGDALVDSGIICKDKPIENPFSKHTGIQALQKLRSRIRELENALVKEIKKLVMHGSLKLEGRTETVLDEIHEIVPEARLFSKGFNGKEELDIDLKYIELKNVKPEASTSIKDIPLDQVSDSLSYRWIKRATIPIERADDKMLELWEAAEDSGLKQRARVRKKPSFSASKRHLLSEPLEISARWKTENHQSSTIFEVETDIQEVNNKKIHDRIESNARKLASLQLIIESLNKKLEAKKKSYESKDIDLEMVEQQMQQVQKSVFQIKEFNGQLITNFEDNSCYSERKREEAASLRSKSALIQARKGSETIRQLQIEVSKLESMLSKLENGMKSKGQGKSRFSRNRTTIILRDVIYNGKNTGKKKKDHLCGCFRSTSYRDTRKCDAL